MRARYIAAVPELPPLFDRRYGEPGSAPGDFASGTGEGGPPAKPRVLVATYDATAAKEWESEERAVLDLVIAPNAVTWIHVQGLGDGTLLRALAERFGLHRLAVADAFNLGQRPKADEYDESTFLVMRAVVVSDEALEPFHWEQLSLFLLDGLVISIEERQSTCLEPLRQRLRVSRQALREQGADHLAALLVDTVVDGYFPALEELGDRLETIEDEILERPGRDVLRRLYRTKRDIVSFRRATWPLREALHDVVRSPGPHFADGVHPYLRDTNDHVVQVVDLLESYRELASSLVDVHVSMLGQRTNETMRVLTVVSTIFIPLTFLAGVYGMNFDRAQPGNMPELGMPYGYVLFWALCIAIAGGLVLVFARLGWLGAKQRVTDDDE